MVTINKHGSVYWWALTSGLIGSVGAGFIIWVVFAFARGYVDPIGWLFVLFPICSVGIALKWRLIGAVLLILQGLSLTVFFGLSIMASLIAVGVSEISFREWYLIVPLIVGVLLALSGILFLKSRK